MDKSTHQDEDFTFVAVFCYYFCTDFPLADCQHTKGNGDSIELQPVRDRTCAARAGVTYRNGEKKSEKVLVELCNEILHEIL